MVNYINRDHIYIEDSVMVCSFVELKNCQIDDQTKTLHLSYVGDSIVGKTLI